MKRKTIKIVLMNKTIKSKKYFFKQNDKHSSE